MKYHQVLALGLSTLALGACASLMMDTKDLDASSSGLVLKEGDRVSISEPDVKVVASESDADNAARVAKFLKEDLTKELAKKHIEVGDGADKQLAIRITGYEKGCGFCRGFFPLFGLGNSAVDGEADLSVGTQHRKLVLNKTGQVSGMAAMGDQTETNTDYFATVAVAHLTESGDKSGEKQEAKKDD